jgi:SAM-dependent methyltransferase
MINDIPPHRPFDAYQAFVLDCKLFWTRQMFPELRRNYAAKLAETGATPQTAEEVRALIGGDTTTEFFGWFERHMQRMKYSGRHGLAVHYAQFRDQIREELHDTVPERLLALDPAFEQPDYYTSIDIHQHPGGVWSDEIAGYVYERGAKSTAPMLNKAESLHHRLTAQALEIAGRKVRAVADLGCGFGGSTRPFYMDHPDMDVVGVELSEPCLRLAARRAMEEQATNVQFRQADAADTGLESERFDLVTSTMVLHEMPPSHIRKLLKESHRLLAPGGVSVHLDFLVRDVEIAAENHRLAAGEADEIEAEHLIPGEPVVEAAQAVLRVGGVNIDQMEIRVFQREDAAFHVVLVDPKAVGDLERLLAGEHRDAGITGFVRRIPMRVVTGHFQRQLDLLGARLGLLQAQDVRHFSGDEFAEVFADHGADPIHIPGKQFHRRG